MRKKVVCYIAAAISIIAVIVIVFISTSYPRCAEAGCKNKAMRKSTYCNIHDIAHRISEKDKYKIKDDRSASEKALQNRKKAAANQAVQARLLQAAQTRRVQKRVDLPQKHIAINHHQRNHHLPAAP